MYFIPRPCFVKTFGPTDEISSWRSCGTFFISCRPDFQSLFRFHCGILDGPFNYKISTGQTILSTWEGHRVWCPVNSRPAFSCTVCGKSFAQKSSLMVHKQIHTGLKFACDMCPKLFSRLDSLRLHKRIHTNNWTTSVAAAQRNTSPAPYCADTGRQATASSASCVEKLAPSDSNGSHVNGKYVLSDGRYYYWTLKTPLQNSPA